MTTFMKKLPSRPDHLGQRLIPGVTRSEDCSCNKLITKGAFCLTKGKRRTSSKGKGENGKLNHWIY